MRFNPLTLWYIVMKIFGSAWTLGRAPPPRSNNDEHPRSQSRSASPTNEAPGYDRAQRPRRNTYISQSQEDAKQQQQVEKERRRVLAEYERQIQDLNLKLDAGEIDNDRLKSRLDERCEQINDLKTSLGESDKKCETLAADRKKLINKYHIHISQLNNANAIIDQQKNEIVTLKQTTANLTFHLDASEKLAQKRALQITSLQQEAEKLRVHITELTEAILDSSQPVTATRDDEYFSGEFARLAGGIRQWVLRYFDARDAPESRHQDLPEVISRSLQKTILGYSTDPDSTIKIGRKEIEAVIAHRLTEKIFNSNFVFKMYHWPFIPTTGFLGVTARETHKFRAQAADMLTKHKDFEVHFAKAVRKIAEDLQQYFPGHVKLATDEARCKVLHAIIEQAARLEVDISRELSRFLVPQLTPGTSYISSYQDDISGTVDDNDDDSSDDDDDTSDNEEGQKVQGKKEGKEEKQENGADQKKREQEFIVDAVLFPPVFRWDFDDAGDIMIQEIIVRKAVVTAIRSESDDGDTVMETGPAESS